MVSIRLNNELEQRLNRLAKTTGRTKTFYIQKLIEEHIDDIEDLYLAAHRLENPEPRLSSKEVREELGLDD